MTTQTGTYLYTLTSIDDLGRVAVPLVLANAALAMGQEALIWLTLDGVKITSVSRKIKDLPLTAFKQLVAEAGLERAHAICNVVQNRMTPAEKADLTVVGEAAQSIRVTLPVGE